MDIFGTDQRDFLRGTTEDDVITALAGDDTIVGSVGTDTVDGGDGYDFLVFDHYFSDILPVPNAPISYTLTDGLFTSSDGSVTTSYTNVERLGFYFYDSEQDIVFDASGFASDTVTTLTIFTGSGNDTVTGSELGEYINVGTGQNTVDAGGGFDTVGVEAEGTGAWFTVTGDSTSLTISEGANTLVTAQNAERVLILPGNSSYGMNIDASGLDGASFIFISTNGSDSFMGTGTNDIFDMAAPNLGAYGTSYDVLTGNGGADLFDFSYGRFSGVFITDFSYDDRMDFTATNRPGLVVAGDIHYGAFTGVAGELVFSWANNQTEIAYDADGDGFIDQFMVLEGGYYWLGSVTVDANGTLKLASLGFSTADVNHTLGADGETFFSGSGDDIIRALGGNDTVYGADGADSLYGGLGADTLDGGAGSDFLAGGDGHDILIGGADGDILWGGVGADRLYGGAGADTLNGGRGADVLYGEGGADYMVGGNFNDVLYGGGGADKLVGGLGADRFAYTSLLDAGQRQSNSDIITDFNQGEGDLIDLSAIDADSNTAGNQGFTFIGTAAFSGTAGELRYVQGATRTIVEMDVDGDGNADAFLRLDGQLDLTAGDFVLGNHSAPLLGSDAAVFG